MYEHDLRHIFYEFKSDMLIHDMIKEELSAWKYMNEQKEYYANAKKEMPVCVGEHIFNFYEYLAYLILNNKIDEKNAKELWKPNILGIYKDFKKSFGGVRINVALLAKKWKD